MHLRNQTTSLHGASYGIKALRSIDIAIDDTVEIADEDWRQEIRGIISDVIEIIKKQQEIDEIIATMAGTLIRVSFNQIGAVPYRKGFTKPVALKKELWRLNAFRRVVYLQTPSQKEQLFLNKQQRMIGVEAQLNLQATYRQSKTNLLFSEWCENHDNTE